MRAVFDHRRDEAANITTFWFRPEKPIHYVAGQYTELTLPHSDMDERGDCRWFTLSSAPGQELVSITTKFNDSGSSFKKVLADLQPGDMVNLAEAMGDFVLPKSTVVPLIFIAGGIGLTPFQSIFEWLIDNEQSRDIKFFYGVRDEDEIIFQDSFEQANIHATIVVSEPSDEWGGERGRLSAELILGIDEPPKSALFYLSGPEQMTEALQKDLLRKGIKKHRIVTDFFPGYGSF